MGMILIDVDFFKSINDRYGHQSGDAILAGVGAVINETVGMSGYPIRYAGDEFVVLLPGLSREECSAVAEALGENVRNRPFKLVNNERTVKITFSVGVSHFPGDTDEPAKLFESADHAAYIAKKNGRNRVVNYQAGVKHALDASTLYQYFPCQKLIGRDEVLSPLIELLLAPAGEKRPWIVLGGAPGVGKTRLLLELRNRVDTQRSVLLETVGIPGRPSQPFGFIIDAVGKYIRENPAAGQQMATALAAQEIATVSRLLPDLSRHVLLSGADGSGRSADLDPVEPLCKMLAALAHNKALTILLDDFQNADQQSMRVLEHLHRKAPTVLVCVAVRDDAETLEKTGVLTQFLNHVVEREIAWYVRLEPFSPGEVQALIESIVPDASKHPELGRLVYEKSGGVALFVEEILKLLIHSRSIRYEGPELVVEVSAEQIPTDADELLEVRAGQVDDDVRVLMARAAVIGQDFDFSTLMMLEGRDEGYLRGILERARKAHIVSEMWSEDANRISFVSVHTHAAFYRSLDEEERRTLHLRLGRMREREYASQLDTALSELAFHFTRGGENERAQQYRKLVSELYSQFVGRTAAQEGVRSEEIRQALGQVELPEELLRKAVDIVSDVKICLQKQRMYGGDHLARQGAYDKLAHHFAELFLHVDAVTYSEADRNMLVNGVLLPPHLQYGSAIIETFLAYDIRALTFHRGVRGPDLKACLDFLGMHREDLRNKGGIGKLLREVGVTTIVPNEKVYVLVGERDIVLKRTSMREERVIKEIEEEERPTRRASPPLPSADASEGTSDEVAQWRREMTRYVDLKMFDDIGRDWRVLQRDLESANRIKILAASKVYVEAGKAAVSPLLLLIGNTEDERARQVAVSLLMRVAADARDLLIRHLFEVQSAPQQAACLAALEAFGDPSLPAEVECFLRHPERSVRQATIRLLAARSRGNLGAFLIRAMEVDDDEVRLDMITAMGEHRIESTTSSLVKILQKTSIFGNEASVRVQAAAAVALGRIGDPEVLPHLLEVLERAGAMQRTKPAIVRAAAATALQHLVNALNKKRIVSELRRYEKDPDEIVAAAARKSLGFVEGPRATVEMPAPQPESGRRLLTSAAREPQIRWRGTRES
jgi:diguanylate cyclase (GGDEF)-like protein